MAAQQTQQTSHQPPPLPPNLSTTPLFPALNHFDLLSMFHQSHASQTHHQSHPTQAQPAPAFAHAVDSLPFAQSTGAADSLDMFPTPHSVGIADAAVGQSHASDSAPATAFPPISDSQPHPPPHPPSHQPPHSHPHPHSPASAGSLSSGDPQAVLSAHTADPANAHMLPTVAATKPQWDGALPSHDLSLLPLSPQRDQQGANSVQSTWSDQWPEQLPLQQISTPGPSHLPEPAALQATPASAPPHHLADTQLPSNVQVASEQMDEDFSLEGSGTAAKSQKSMKSRTGRRQNSACDACRASKKGCDLQLQVTYNDIGVSVKPLIKCSTCKRRGIECTTHEVHLIKSANGCFRPEGGMSVTAQARLAALSSSLSASLAVGPPGLSGSKRRRAAGVPRQARDVPSRTHFNAVPSVLLKSEDAREHQSGQRDDGDETAERVDDETLIPHDGHDGTEELSAQFNLFEQLEALASVPCTSRTISSINQSAMLGTLISRTLSLYSSIMEGPMTLWLSHDSSHAKPVFAVDEIQRSLVKAASLHDRPGSSSSSPASGSDRTRQDSACSPHSHFEPLEEGWPDSLVSPGARKLLYVLKQAKVSWAEWTSSGSSIGIGLADAEGTDSSKPGSTPNLVFVATILDAAFEADIDPCQAGRDMNRAWAQRARWRTWVRSGAHTFFSCDVLHRLTI